MIGIKPERAQREVFFGKLLLDLTIKKSCTYCESKNVSYIKIITIKFQIKAFRSPLAPLSNHYFYYQGTLYF